MNNGTLVWVPAGNVFFLLTQSKEASGGFYQINTVLKIQFTSPNPNPYPTNALTKSDFQSCVFKLIRSLCNNSCPFVYFLCYRHYRIVTEFRGATKFRFITLRIPFCTLHLCAIFVSISVSIFVVPNFTTSQLEHIFKSCGMGFQRMSHWVLTWEITSYLSYAYHIVACIAELLWSTLIRIYTQNGDTQRPYTMHSDVISVPLYGSHYYVHTITNLWSI